MKKSLLIAVLLLNLISLKVYAEETLPPIVPDPISIHLTITTPSNSLYDQEINVVACDSDNPSAGTLKVTAYCAVLQSGLSNDWNFAWAPGIFLNSINSIAGFTSKDADGNDVYHYWSWSLNGNEAQTGLNQYELQPNDLISLTFIDPPVPEPVVVEEHHHSSGSRIVVPTKTIFDSKKAFEFLITQQKEDGSFGEDLYTDWSALALTTTTDYQDQKTKLIEYLNKIKTTEYLLTDYERHTMALMSLGINPYDINGENYIKKITDAFDGKQFGDPEKDNDDIFALIVLQNAGYTKDDEIVKKTVDFILSKQKENGSWDNSVDLTGAALQVIAGENFLLRGVSQADEPRGSAPLASGDSDLAKEEFSLAINKAKEFLKQNQKDDGGFGNVSSTAWVMEGILALGEKPEDWLKNNNTPIDYFAINQDTDGGIKNENKESKLWETAYVLSSLPGKTWREIMQKFTKPTIEQTNVVKKNEILKSEIKKITKIKNLKKLVKEITASSINAIPETQPQEIQKKTGWFRNLINKIFGF